MLTLCWNSRGDFPTRDTLLHSHRRIKQYKPNSMLSSTSRDAVMHYGKCSEKQDCTSLIQAVNLDMAMKELKKLS